MYDTLLKHPKIYKGDCCNAYVFGKFFPTSTYSHLRYHGNDGAQTGLIDVNLWKDGIYSDEAHDINDSHDYTYDSIENVCQIRELTQGAVLFQGYTVGGDIGANLFVHYNLDTKEIDSLIIDNNYFFKGGVKLREEVMLREEERRVKAKTKTKTKTAPRVGIKSEM